MSDEDLLAIMMIREGEAAVEGEETIIMEEGREAITGRTEAINGVFELKY